MKKRIFEIDAVRGLAIILMVAYHIAVDLNDFFNIATYYDKGLLSVIGPLSASIFIFVSGVSATLTTRNIKRGLIVLSCGLLITAATYLYEPDAFVIFGILQFLGFAMIIYYFLRNQKPYVFAILAFVSIVLGMTFSKITLSSYMLLPFGIMPTTFKSVDYYPLFPYLWLFFSGSAFGKVFYKEKTTLFKSAVCRFKILSFLGRHSLFIYLLHQPVIMLILYVTFSI